MSRVVSAGGVPVQIVTKYLAEDSTILAYKLLSVDGGYTYEVTCITSSASGNGWDGVQIFGVGSDGNVVAGNYIGTSASGGFAVPNVASGVASLTRATSPPRGSSPSA